MAVHSYIARTGRDPINCNDCAFKHFPGQGMNPSDPHLIGWSSLGISWPVNDDAIVGLVDEVRAAADVIQVGGFSAPVLQLPGVGHQPHMHLVVLGEALDLGQHLAHVLRLRHVRGPLVVQLIVWVDYQPPDPKSAPTEDPDARLLFAGIQAFDPPPLLIVHTNSLQSLFASPLPQGGAQGRSATSAQLLKAPRSSRQP